VIVIFSSIQENKDSVLKFFHWKTRNSSSKFRWKN